jgi:protein-tyrosine-phosphatase/DNA-binding transcriptional ArsR family regulator
VSAPAAELSVPEFLQLVADGHRWQILTELGRSDRRVGELTDLVGRPQNLVSYHLAELRKAGLVTARRSAADGRDTYYRVDLLRCRNLLGAVTDALHPGLSVGDHDHEVPPARGRPPIVLFLCTGNSARSQMAEALLVHRSGGAIRARSAGSHPKPLHPDAVRVMAERGIDIADNQTKHLRRFTRSRFDRVITLCDKVREICPEFPGNPPAVHWSMADPAADGGSDDAFERTADELEVRTELLMGELTRPDQGRAHAH